MRAAGVVAVACTVVLTVYATCLAVIIDAADRQDNERFSNDH